MLKKHDISAIDSKHHHRCYRNKATEKYLLLGKEGVEYVDLESGEVIINRWVRGACLYGVMPANGLLYLPPEQCGCYIESKLTAAGAAALQRSADAVRSTVAKMGV